MKLVDPSDPDLIAIEEHVNGQMASARPIMQNSTGNVIVQNMLQYAAQAICPERRLTFQLVKHPVSRMVGVQCYEIEPHMSQENPYQSQRSMDTYRCMLDGLIRKKLEAFLGPYYNPTTYRPTRNESLFRNAYQERYSEHRLNRHDSRT